MMPTATVPVYDWKVESSSYYAQELELRSRATNPGEINKASAPILNVDPVGREVRMAAGSYQIRYLDGATGIPQLRFDYFAPYAVDSIFPEATRSPELNQATQTTGGYLARFSIQKKAGSRMQNGRAHHGSAPGLINHWRRPGYWGILESRRLRDA